MSHTDIEDLLREDAARWAADHGTPPSFTDMFTIARTRRQTHLHDHRRLIAAMAAAATVLILAVAIPLARSGTQTHRSPQQPGATTASVPAVVGHPVASTALNPNGLRLTVTLPSDHMRAGAHMNADVALTNEGSKPYKFEACHTGFLLVFADHHTTYGVNRTASLTSCAPSVLTHGQSYHYTWQLTARYTSWANTCASKPQPCTPAGPPPLPPGPYKVKPYDPEFPVGTILPAPIAVTITP